MVADIGEHTSAGETDPEVGEATFRAVLERDPSHDEMTRPYTQYLWHLSEDIWTSKDYRVIDGAERLLTRLGGEGVVLEVISGRWRAPRARRWNRETQPVLRLRLLRFGLARPHRTDPPGYRQGGPAARLLTAWHRTRSTS
ncbi:MAG: hypothetical protein ACR2G2_00765 [Pseudonocardia sp.]